MTGFVTALTGTDGITSANLWGEVTTAAPLIVTMFLFAFGFAVVRRLLKGKGRTVKM